MDKKEQKLYCQLVSNRSGRYLTVNVEFVTIDDDGRRSPLTDYEFYENSEFSRVRIHAQCDTDSQEFYGSRVEYDSWGGSLSLDRAELIVKGLRKIDKGLDKIIANEGYTGEFAEYVTRVLRVTGCKGYLRDSRNDAGFYIANNGCIRDDINRLLAEFKG